MKRSQRAALLASALLLGACGAPASYDGLSGGATEQVPPKEDSSVATPRPIAPISVSFIASSRPRLRWDLSSKNLTGAIVEMSRTRSFTNVAKRFEAPGSELVVPEDLELGVWFWRLKGAAVGSFGTTTSPTWEMVVRGPAAHGSSDAATRSMVDIDGDGEPDLLVGATGDDGPSGPMGSPASNPGTTSRSAPLQPAGKTGPSLLYYKGASDHAFANEPYDGGGYQVELAPYDGPMAIGAGTDFNGDGYGDIIESGLMSYVDQGKRSFTVNILYASQRTDAPPISWDNDVPIFLGDGPTLSFPSVREAGDVDGDGYGDSVIGLPFLGVVVIGVGSTKALPAVLPIYPAGGGSASPALPPSRVAMGGFDANGDGLADVVFSLSDSYQPSARAFAAAGSRTERIGEPQPLDAPDARLATAFTAGDFNGDGIDDIAITTPVGSSSRVCLWYGNRDKLVTKGPCVAAPAGDIEFGSSLTAADIEGDGIDELLATAKRDGHDAVRVVHFGIDGSATAAPIGVPGLGVRLTTLWPGRPGKARWAAVAADGSRVGVFEGDQLRSTLVPPTGIVGGFGRGLR